MADPGMQALTVLCRRAACSSQSRPHDYRYLEFAAGHIMHLGGLVRNLIHRQPDEVAEHQVHHRAHAGHGTTYSQPGDACFRDRRVDYTSRTKFFDQPGKDLERRSGLGHIFTNDKYGWVTAHLFGQRFTNGLGKRDLAHALTLWCAINLATIRFDAI